ncbi:MAG: NmrA family NAD(P)-binding protein [Proteobacteria bacterium]|nr:NmrA family NAD(P)-binding protein [Pseudomonadota bacterium]
MSRVLVYQSNGVQGSAVLEHARQAGFTVRALVRNIEKASPLMHRGFEVVSADFHDREALANAHDSVDYVIAQIPAYSDGFAEEAIKNSVFAMKRHGIKGVILKMANPTPVTSLPDTGFSVNSIIISEMNSSGLLFTSIEPTMYLDTLLKPNIRNEISTLGLIDLPIRGDLKIAWTCVDDAAWLSVSLLKERVFGLTIRCMGEREYCGTDLADIFSAILGKPIGFKSTAVDEFQQEIEAAIGAENAKPVVAKFRFLAEHPTEAQAMLDISREKNWVFKPTSVQEWLVSKKDQFALAS